MRHRCSTPHRILLSLAFLYWAALTGALASSSDPGWPRTYSDGQAEITVYQPQIEAWLDFKHLKGRCAFALRAARSQEPVYGTFRFEGDTLTDADRRLVLIRNVRATDLRFPGGSESAAAEWRETTRRLLPKDALVVALDRILAYVKANEAPRIEARVLSDPPPIFVRTQPAVLVIVDGEPVMAAIDGTSLSRVLNTNWELVRSRKSGQYYLRHEQQWLVASDLEANYEIAASVPADLLRLPAPAQQSNPSTSSSAPSAAPKVIIAKRPSELIVLRGAPELAPLAGTELSWVANSSSDLFFHNGTRSYYFLASGRWFRASSLNGPWQFASSTLPEDFRRIPATHPRGHVLASVPGTREAEDAVLLAAIPRTVAINRGLAKADVQYVGHPQFVSIATTRVAYAKNTQSDVFRVGTLYYLCFQGVWFVSSAPSGPWEATGKVPQEIYSIPESSPKYNVTYVKVYESTPTTIVFGYTPGYYGAYVAGGVVVWGTGYYYPPYVAVGVAPVYWGVGCYTYGADAWYNLATGTFARGAAVYGPYGGYGAAAAYNPRTGTYAQGAAIWGPNGGAAAARTYNPATGAASAGYHAAGPYGSWGEGAVTNGSNWARGGYQSTSRGTVAAGETSAGGAGVAIQGAGGNSGYLARSGSGDVYAGANGNVYKREDGQWYRNQNGSWNTVDRSTTDAQRQQAAARDHGSRNAQASERWRGSGASAPQVSAPQASAPHPRGGGSRPQFQGRRR